MSTLGNPFSFVFILQKNQFIDSVSDRICFRRVLIFEDIHYSRINLEATGMLINLHACDSFSQEKQVILVLNWATKFYVSTPV